VPVNHFSHVLHCLLSRKSTRQIWDMHMLTTACSRKEAKESQSQLQKLYYDWNRWLVCHTHTVHRLNIPCNARWHNNFAFAFQLMTVGLLNIAGIQNLKYQDQGSFRSSRTVVLNLFTPADWQKRQKIFKDWQHTITMNGPDYHNHFVNQSYGFIPRILIFRK